MSGDASSVPPYSPWCPDHHGGSSPALPLSSSSDLFFMLTRLGSFSHKNPLLTHHQNSSVTSGNDDDDSNSNNNDSNNS